MRHMRVSLFVVLYLCGAGAVVIAADGPDVGEIFEQAEQVRSPDLDYAVDFTLHTTNPHETWKERTARYTMIAKGKDHSLVLMREPSQFYPGTLLIQNNLYWLIFPRTEKPIQLSVQQVLNGDISNGDLARGNLLRNYEAALVGEEEVDGRKCYRLELAKKSNIAHYPRIVYWVEKKKFRPRQLKYYGKTGALLKTVNYNDYKKGAIGTRAMRIEVDAPGHQDLQTTLTFTNLRRIEASALDFSTEGLVAFRDAAKKKFDDDGVQALPEDLLTLLSSGTP